MSDGDSGDENIGEKGDDGKVGDKAADGEYGVGGGENMYESNFCVSSASSSSPNDIPIPMCPLPLSPHKNPAPTPHMPRSNSGAVLPSTRTSLPSGAGAGKLDGRCARPSTTRFKRVFHTEGTGVINVWKWGEGDEMSAFARRVEGPGEAVEGGDVDVKGGVENDPRGSSESLNAMYTVSYE